MTYLYMFPFFLNYEIPNLNIYFFKTFYFILEYSLVAQRLKNLAAMQETCVQSLGWEDPVEKRMATHASILAWRIPWTEEPGGLPSIRSQEARYD